MTFLNVATSSAIYDYNTLIAEAADHIDRDDLGDKWARFVQMVEAYMLRELRVLDMETVTQVVGSGPSLALPDDCLTFRALNIAGAPLRELRGMSPAAIPHEFSGHAGIPQAYTRVGDAIYLYPPPASDTTLDLVYLAKFAPLTETSPANWLLLDHPDVYFYGILAHACAYIQDSDNAAAYSALFESTVEGIKQARNKDRWGSGPLVPNGPRQVRSASC